MNHRLNLRAACFVIASALASNAQAGWTLATTDAPVDVIHGVNMSTATAGGKLDDGDLLESHEGVVHLQDDHRTLVALGPHTRAMIAGDAHVALLQGWLKFAAASCAAQPCAPPRVDTQRGPLDIGANAAAIVATSGDADTVDVFSETGTQTFASKPPASIGNGHFASIDTQAHVQASARPSEAFVAAMPVAFRDALQPLPNVRPSQRQTQTPPRTVNYDDIAPWLVSTLPQRKTFPARFRSRLSDKAFRRDIDTHLKALPDWRALLYPPKHRVRYP